MPCDSGQGWSSYDSTAHREIERLTRVSCDIMRVIEQAGIPLNAFSPETQSWWTQHKAHDEQKEAAAQAQVRREQLRQAGLAKLSPDERKALGL